LPPLARKQIKGTRVNGAVFMNSVQLIVPKVAASEKEVIMSKQKYNEMRRKEWHRLIDRHDDNQHLLEESKGKKSNVIINE
jgi:hypothetical protein